MKYELCYLVGEAKEPQLKAIGEKVRKTVSDEGGQWLEPETAQKRKLAYKVKGEIRGTYVAQRFDIPEIDAEGDSEKKDVVSAIAHKLNLDNDVLRLIIVKADELPELKIPEAPAFAKSLPSRKFVKPSEPVKKEEKKEKKKEVKEESIDKKLEEILNI